MSIHIPPRIHAESDHIAAMLPQMGPTTNSLSPATQSDILATLQREQDRAMLLHSLNPLLSSPFVSYANRATPLESAATPSPDSEERKVLQATIAALREENDKLRAENREMAEKLEAAVASQGALRTLVAALKKDAKIQQDRFRMLAEQGTEGADGYNRPVAELNVEQKAFRAQILDLEARRVELEEAAVERRIETPEPEPRGLGCLSSLSRAADTRKSNSPEDRNTPNLYTRVTKTERGSGEEAKEQIEKAGWEKVDEPAKGETEREATEEVEREAEEKVKREAEEAVEQAGRKAKETAEQEEEKVEKEAEAKSKREAKEIYEGGRESPTPNIPSPWGSTVGEDDRSSKTSTLPQEEQKVDTQDPGSTKKDSSDLPPTSTSSPPSPSDDSHVGFGLFDGPGMSFGICDDSDMGFGLFDW